MTPARLGQLLLVAVLALSAGPTTAPTTAPADATTFMGVPSGPADSVVFLIDTSGSMVSVLPRVKAELESAVARLGGHAGAAPSVNLIFYNEGVLMLYRDGPRPATRQTLTEATELTDGLVSIGPTNPLPAILTTLDERPSVVYVLTDGWDQVADMGAVVKLFKENGGHTRVHCIFLESKPDAKLSAALKQIAADSYGRYKVIVKKDL